MRININDLLPDTEYVIQLKSTNENSASQWSRRFAFTTTKDTAIPLTPGLISWENSGSSFHAVWESVNKNTAGEDIVVQRYELELTANGISKIVDCGDQLEYTLELDQNKNLFGSRQPSIAARLRAVDNKDLRSNWTGSQIASAPPPPAPEFASAAGLIHGISVAWGKPSNEDLITHYVVYVGETPDFDHTQASRAYSGNGDSFFHSTLDLTEKHFKVFSVDAFGQLSDAVSTSAQAQDPFEFDDTPPSVPSNVSATVSNVDGGTAAEAAVSWDAVTEDDLVGYRIRYRQQGVANWRFTTAEYDVTETDLSLAHAYTTYEFGVASVDKFNNTSAFSDTVTASPPANTAPPKVQNVVATPGVDSVRITWDDVAEDDLRHYEIDLADDSGFSNMVSFRSGTSNSLNVSGLATGDTYYARVRAVDTSDEAGAWSDTNTFVTGDFPQPTPEDIGAATQEDLDAVEQKADNAQLSADGKSTIYRQPTKPTSGKEGDTWYDTSDGNKINVHDGNDFVPTQDADISEAAQAAADAATAASDAHDLAGSKNRITTGAAPHSDPDVDDLWIDTGNGNVLKQWDGNSWEIYQDEGIQQAITSAGDAATAASNAQDAADAAATAASNAQDDADAANQELLDLSGIVSDKGTVYAQDSEPAGDPNGLWIDTDNGNKPHRWDGSNWVVIQDSDIQAAANAASNAQSTADDAAAAAATAQNRADDAHSIATSAQTAADNAATAAANAQDDADAAQTAANNAQSAADDANQAALDAAGIANEKAVVLYQTSAPGTSYQNDKTLWIDITNGENTPKRWNGSIWATITDKAALDAAQDAADAHTAANNAQDAADTAQNRADNAYSLANSAKTIADDAQARVEVTEGQISTVEGDISSIETRVSNAEGEITTITSSVSDINTDVGNIETRVTTAEGTLTNVEGRVETAEGTISSHESRLNDAEGNIDDVTTIVTAKNTTTYSIDPPGNAENSAGDSWYQKNGSGEIIGQWEGQGGTSWNPVTITDEVITNLNAGTITAGTLHADRIGANTIDSSKIVTAGLDAGTIKFGTMSGDRIEAGSLTIEQVSGLDNNLSKKGRVWHQTTPPVPDWYHHWTGETHNSTSQLVEDGQVTTKNFFPNSTTQGSDGEVEYAKNLVINPRMEATDGTVEVSRNLAASPQVRVTDDLIYVARNYYVGNNMAFAGSGDDTSIAIGPTFRGFATPATEGETFTITRQAKNNNRFRFAFFDHEPVEGSEVIPGSATFVDGVTEITLTAPATSQYLVGYLSNADETIDGIMVAKSPHPIPFFDGDTPDDDTFIYLWDGDESVKAGYHAGGWTDGTGGQAIATPSWYSSSDNAVMYYATEVRNSYIYINSNTGYVNRTAVSYGDFISARVTVHAIVDCDIQFRLYGYNDGSSVGPIYSLETVSMVAGETRTFEIIDVENTIDANGFLPIVYIRDHTVLGPICKMGEGAIFNHGQSPSNWTSVPYFDGDTPDDDSFTYSWSGAAGESESIKTAQRVTNWASNYAYQIEGNKLLITHPWAWHQEGIEVTGGDVVTAIVTGVEITGSREPDYALRFRFWGNPDGAEWSSDTVVTDLGDNTYKVIATVLDGHNVARFSTSTPAGDTVTINSLLVTKGNYNGPYFDGDSDDVVENLHPDPTYTTLDQVRAYGDATMPTLHPDGGLLVPPSSGGSAPTNIGLYPDLDRPTYYAVRIRMSAEENGHVDCYLWSNGFAASTFPRFYVGPEPADYFIATDELSDPRGVSVYLRGSTTDIRIHSIIIEEKEGPLETASSFFSGDTPDTAQYEYSWTGEPGASTSIKRDKTFTYSWTGTPHASESVKKATKAARVRRVSSALPPIRRGNSLVLATSEYGNGWARFDHNKPIFGDATVVLKNVTATLPVQIRVYPDENWGGGTNVDLVPDEPQDIRVVFPNNGADNFLIGYEIVGGEISIDGIGFYQGDYTGEHFDGTYPSSVDNDLWIDTSNENNTPHKWDEETSTWKQVTDKVARDAHDVIKVWGGGTVEAGVTKIQGGQIETESVTADQIAANQISSEHMIAGTITAGSGIIAEAAIGEAEIADAAITTAKIGDAQIVEAKIGDGEITNAKIANLDAAKITSGYISSDRIEANSLSIGHISGLDDSLNERLTQSEIEALDYATQTYVNTTAASEAATAKSEALDEAAIDAQTKAENAASAAETAAKNHADLVAQGAEDDAIAAAATDAQQKADAAAQAAEDAAKAHADSAAADAKAEALQEAASAASAEYSRAKLLTETWGYPTGTEMSGAYIRTGTLAANQIVVGGGDSTPLDNELASKETPDGAQQKANTAAGTAETNAKNHADNEYAPIKNRVEDWTYTGTTTIDGGKIETDSITSASGAIADLSADKITAGTFGNGVGIDMAPGSSIRLNGGHIRSNSYGATSYTPSKTSGFYIGNDGLHIADGDVSAKALTSGTITGETITLSGANAKIVGNGFTLSGDGLDVQSGTIAASAITLTSTFKQSVVNNTVIDGGQITTSSITAEQLRIVSDDNFTNNSDFEDGFSVGWAQYSLWGRNTSGPYSGSYKAYAELSTTATLRNSYQLPVAQGEMIKVEAAVKYDEDVNANPVHFGVYYSDGSTDVVEVDVSNATSEWESISHTAEVPPNVTWASFYVKTNSGGGIGKYFRLDSVSLIKQWAGRMVVDGSITGRKIAADAITAREVSSDIVDTESLESGFILTGEIAVGSNISISEEDGIVSTLADGGEIRLPADGSPANITAHIQARSIDVANNLTIRGELNKISGGLYLEDGVTAPTAPPSVGAYYESVVLSGIDEYFNPYGLTDTADGTQWVVASHFFGVHLVFFDKVTGNRTWGQLVVSDAEPADVERIGNDYYILWRKYSNGDWFISQHPVGDFTTEIRRWFVLETTTVPNQPGLIRNEAGTEISFIHTNRNGTLRRRTYSLNGTLLASNAFSVGQKMQRNVVGGYYGSADIGVDRWYVAYGSYVDAFNSSRNNTNADEFPYANGSHSVGFCWSAHTGRFHTLTPNNRVYSYASAINSGNIEVEYTWYDSDPAGSGTHETDPGPPVIYNLPSRAGVSVTTSSPPDTGEADAPDRARVYINGSLQPHDRDNGGRWYTIGTSGQNPPTTNGFLSANTAPGSLTSGSGDANGPYIKFTGAGDAYIKNLETGPVPYGKGIKTNSSNTVSSGTWTNIGFEEVYDRGDITVNSNNSNVFIIDREGLYAIYAQIIFDSSGTGYRGARIHINGADAGASWASGRNWYTVNVSTVAYLTAGDTINIQCYQNSGSNQSIATGTDRTQAYIYRIGN